MGKLFVTGLSGLLLFMVTILVLLGLVDIATLEDDMWFFSVVGVAIIGPTVANGVAVGMICSGTVIMAAGLAVNSLACFYVGVGMCLAAAAGDVFTNRLRPRSHSISDHPN